MSQTTRLHVQSHVTWGKLAKAMPQATIQMPGVPDDYEWDALVFIDEDGEIDVYAFGPGGRASLVADLTGGIVVADSDGRLQ